MMHGGFGSASQAEKSYHAGADAGHFLLACPNGLNRAWNAGGGRCGAPARDGTDDIGFITAVVSATEHMLPADPRRIYATGISNGGIRASDLACHTTVFAAAGPDSATQPETRSPRDPGGRGVPERPDPHASTAEHPEFYDRAERRFAHARRRQRS
jgi:poly(3-hydroxybutyrate) depolymerase